VAFDLFLGDRENEAMLNKKRLYVGRSRVLGGEGNI
jgi:hypothetical protein